MLRQAILRSFEHFVARIIFALLGVAIVVKLGFIVAYARHMRWVMDEFGQGYCGRFIPIGLYSKIDPIKTALPYPLYYAAIELGGSAVAVLQLWRASTTMAALLTVAATALAARRLYRNAQSTLLAVFCLLCFTNFLEHSFRVRNDSFAVMFAVLSLVALLRDDRPLWSTYGSGLLAGTAFLCTQKSVYQVVALLLAQLAYGWAQAGRAQGLMRAARYAAGGAIAILAYGVAFGGLHAPNVIAAVFLGPLELKDNVLSSAAFPGIRQYYIAQTIERNALTYLMCLVGLLISLAARHLRTPPRFAAGLATLVITLAVFMHPQSWPYVFVMCMPFLALFAPACFELARARWRPFWVLAVSALLCLSFLRNTAVLSHGNSAQLRVVRQAEAMLGPHDRYFDGVGMIPTRDITGRHPYWSWDAPITDTLRRQLASGNSANFAPIFEQQPKLWIMNYRFQRMADWLGSILQLATVSVSDVIRVTGRSIAPGEIARFQNLWAGKYRLIGSDGSPSAAVAIVDGQLCPAPCAISVGNHRLQSDSLQPVFLLPADILPPGPLPVRAHGFDLYANIYDF